MSIMVVQVVPAGILIGADQQITIIRTTSDVTTGWPKEIVDYEKRDKVFKWPNGKVLMAYVGSASIEGHRVDEFLKKFIDSNNYYSSFSELCFKLTGELNAWLNGKVIGWKEPIIIHVASFIKENGIFIPQIYYIRNAKKLTYKGYEDISNIFECREEFWLDEYFGKIAHKDIRDHLSARALFQPFWFHQGTDLLAFNILDKSMTLLFNTLLLTHPKHRKIPEKIEDWSSFLKMVILSYESYHRAFKDQNNQKVAGVDVVTLDWPE